MLPTRPTTFSIEEIVEYAGFRTRSAANAWLRLHGFRGNRYQNHYDEKWLILAMNRNRRAPRNVAESNREKR